jgi:DMSO/TMAO reductase YedYZ molybdopterin-dependent catalytic subunit
MTPDPRHESARRTRRSLLTGGLAAMAGLGAFEWLKTRREDDGIEWPLRLALRANEETIRDYFGSARLSRTFPASAIEAPRPNGDIGLEEPVPADWSLRLADAEDDMPGESRLTLADIQALPKVEQITEFKCIEGWSRILQWGGARFSDFVAKYAPDRMDFDPGNDYVGFETPLNEYYVGLDMASAMHPQTLLAYELNGKPLEAKHGAPLRLAIPLKYGIKNLKRIGRIAFAATRPADYWAEQGYDWYAGF